MLAERLKQLRKEKGMTQIDFAKALGVSNGTVAMWETGKRKPGYDTMYKIAELFDKLPSYIAGFSEDARAASSIKEEVSPAEYRALDDERKKDLRLLSILDEKGAKAVHDIIREQISRCVLEGTLRSSDYMMVENKHQTVQITSVEDFDSLK